MCVFRSSHLIIVLITAAPSEGLRSGDGGGGSSGTHELVSKEEHGLDGEPAVAEVEQVLERGPQQLHHHHIVVPLLPEPLDLRDPNCKAKRM
jgi:hypothetical protein